MSNRKHWRKANHGRDYFIVTPKKPLTKLHNLHKVTPKRIKVQWSYNGLDKDQRMAWIVL